MSLPNPANESFDAICERSAYLIPWLERLEMISLERLSDSFGKDEAAQQAEIDIVRGAIARLVSAQSEREETAM